MVLPFKFSVIDIIDQGRTTSKDIDLIKEWNMNLKEKCIPILSNELVTIFLLSCSNDINHTKKTIENYYKIKQLAPVLFNDRNTDSEEFQLTVNTSAFAPIHWIENNTVIIYCKMLDTNYRNCYMDQQLKVGIMTIDSIIAEYAPKDFIIIQDVKGIGMMHLTRVKLHLLKIFFNYIQEALPLQLKAVHYINANYALKQFISIAKCFIKAELFNKITFHSGFDDLHDFIPIEYIPSNFNGHLVSIEELQRDSVRRLRDMQTFWDAEEAMRKQCITKNDNRRLNKSVEDEIQIEQ